MTIFFPNSKICDAGEICWKIASQGSLREAAVQNSLSPIFDLHWQTIHNVQRGLSFQSLSLKCQSHEKTTTHCLREIMFLAWQRMCGGTKCVYANQVSISRLDDYSKDEAWNDSSEAWSGTRLQVPSQNWSSSHQLSDMCTCEKHWQCQRCDM